MQITLNEAMAAERTIVFQCLSDIDGVSPVTGLTFGTATDLKVAKAAVEANFGGTVTEIAAGFYKYLLSSGEVNTAGIGWLRLNISGVRPELYPYQIV